MLSPLELVYDAEPAPRLDLPEQLQALYGGHIGFDRPSVFANFVSSLDGVVAIPAETQSATMISDHNEADRFVMGLLRACADVVLIGSGTMKARPDHSGRPSASTHPPRRHTPIFEGVSGWRLARYSRSSQAARSTSDTQRSKRARSS